MRKQSNSNELVKLLQNVRPLGQFAVGGSIELPFPGMLCVLFVGRNEIFFLFLFLHVVGLAVTGVGDVPLPIYEPQAKQLISQSEKAPYGKKEKTLRDTRVRDTWQIDGKQVQIQSSRIACTDFLAGINIGAIK